MRFLSFAAGAALLLLSLPATAEDYQAGDLMIGTPWTQATPPAAPTAAGYMMIHNMGTEPDYLTGGSSPLAGAVEVHQMSMKNGIMSMKEVDAIEIPAGGMVMLSPAGNYHLMLTGLKSQVMPDEKVPVTLNFRKAGPVTVELEAYALGHHPDGAKTMMQDHKH
jgi:copper(I)-binding protein